MNINSTLFEFAKLILVDCGASYFPPDTWQIALASPNSYLILVDPNGDNLSYASQIGAKFSTITKALSSCAGLETLYISNTDSGTSLLPPVARTDLFKFNSDYFFPMIAKNIIVSTLSNELDLLNNSSVDCIKLDTQGSELSILKGLDQKRLNNLLFVELEVSLQSPPVYKGAPSLGEVSLYLESEGFQLANIRLSRNSHPNARCLARPNECDVLFVRPLHLLADRDKDPSILSKLLLLSNMYYLYDFADDIIDYLSSLHIFSAVQMNSILQSQQHIRLLQNKLLDQGQISLWHRDTT